MATVTVFGSVFDHSRTPISAVLQPRLWAVPRQANLRAALFTGGEVQCNLNTSTGRFSVDLESDPDIEYTFRLDYLRPGQESEPPEKRARGFEEWPIAIRADVGGELASLTNLQLDSSLVYASPTATDSGVRVGFQLNTVTGDLYQRKVTF